MTKLVGVRPLRRVVEQEIRDKVTDFHLDYLDAKHLEADMEDGGLVIRENPNTLRKSNLNHVNVALPYSSTACG